MNEIDEALRRFDKIIQTSIHDANGVKVGSINTAYLRHGDIKTIRKTLTAAKEREVVDVEGLKKTDKPSDDLDDGEFYAEVNRQEGYNQAIDDMHERGLLTSSEKPTHSIPAAKGEGE